MSKTLKIGLDIGSTTVKIIVLSADLSTVLFKKYLRHNSFLVDTVLTLLRECKALFPTAEFSAALCGSGGKAIADTTGAFFVQEVVANSIAIKKLYKSVSVAVELGGQDAKIIFFHFDESTHELIASDMRMNGSCAGGTGAFIDEIASLLKIPIEEFDSFASRGTKIYDISGRCGVFAKTDIQPLLNQGAKKEDIALSALHAIVKQIIGGMAQGLELKPPIIFEGGPLSFIPSLISVFKERLELSESGVIIPQNPEVLVAHGAALAIEALFDETKSQFSLDEAIKKLERFTLKKELQKKQETALFFQNEAEKTDFFNRHKNQLAKDDVFTLQKGILKCYVGVDAGSTTTKFVLLSEDERVIDSVYMHNDGDPLTVFKKAAGILSKKYRDLEIDLHILGFGTTGYGELLFAKAFGADYHTVETVAHAKAALHYVPAATFVLDIGGQDMKAISISDDIVTGIILNEACSAGCGSFLENFAKNLNIAVTDIAETAFESKNPAVLGSRCTVFMNSCIISEQKNGKTGADIAAGLCRSLIENVFTKVVRISNIKELGNKIVVQGGTFKNDAVLRALEQYTGVDVIRSPYPGEMGAIGIALLTKRRMEELKSAGMQPESHFIGFDQLSNFTCTQETNVICPFCTNNCNRTVISFMSGEKFITGNRCERGEIIGEVDAYETKRKIEGLTKKINETVDMFALSEKLLFGDFDYKQVSPSKDITIGLARCLEFWNSMPFWKTFFLSLGFKVRLSSKSSRKLFEQGLQYVTSDTVCFPAKLVHGHVRSLLDKKVDRIFMPMLMRMPSENTDPLSTHVCAVVKGYPLVIAQSDNPKKRTGIQFDSPIFHWYNIHERDAQIIAYMANTFDIHKNSITAAIKQADRAADSYVAHIQEAAQTELARLESAGGFGVVIAGRPYHTDSFINHDLPKYFTRQGIPVFTLSSLAGLYQTDLTYSRIEISNNFHARVVSGALYVANHPNLEFVELVSFGCGHDAILSDEASRILREVAGKNALILKADEGDVRGPFNIRVKSFIETVKTKRKHNKPPAIKALKDPYPIKFTKNFWKNKTILIPNVSVAFCKLTSAVISRQGFKVAPLPLADEETIKLGKKYVHNDMCFPAQVNIGEFLHAMEKKLYNPDEVVFGLAKYQCDCRLAHYAALARKAMDEAGYPQVPIITTDAGDSKNMYPGFRLGMRFEIRMVWGIAMIDIFEELLRRIRPYEKNAGETDRVFNHAVDSVTDAMKNGIKAGISAFKNVVGNFAQIPFDAAQQKHRVFIIGEYLLNYHPGSNFYIEAFLEKNDMEVVLPRMMNVFHRNYLLQKSQHKQFKIKLPLGEVIGAYASDAYINNVISTIEGITLKKVPFFTQSTPIEEIASQVDHIMHRTFTSGEGWLIPGEILHYAQQGVQSFVILQPFGCIPNHICGRGVIKSLKQQYPGIQILPLDYDPDVSHANLENRLQMLIMNARSRQTTAPYAITTPEDHGAGK